MLYDILFWIAIGLVMGFIARAIVPGEQKIGLIPTIIVGAIGSFLGAFLAQKMGFDVSSFNVVSITAAIIGSLILLVIWCLIFKGKIRG